MQNKPLLNLHNNKVLSVNATSKKPQFQSAQHAPHVISFQSSKDIYDDHKRQSFLVELPDESLGHIIAYVDTPSSLIALSQVNRKLRNYVTDDSTWYRSFAYRYFGIGPECYPSSWQSLMLRRSEKTWKKEFIKRYEVILRWEKSRSAVMSYQPHSWNMDSMHLMDNMSLMTTSLQYGIVARSFPLTGKILRGFLDASGTANGFGIGNPNVEFSPHVSCIAVSSRGGTAYIIWGFRNGEIALTTAPRVMDSDRPVARYLRCRAQDEHAGQVQSLIFTSVNGGDEDDLVFSSCSRGQIKVWDSKRLRCFWSGSVNKDSDHDVPDPCVKLAFQATTGILAAVCQSGDIVVWPGFKVYRDSTSGYMVLTEDSIRIVSPCVDKPKAIASLFVDPESGPYKAIILVRYAEDRHFVRYDVNVSRKSIVCSRFDVNAEGSFPITSLKPCFIFNKSTSSSTTTPPTVSEGTSSTLLIHLTSQWTKRSSPFILTGDSLGIMSVWDWDIHSDELSSNNNNNDYKVIQSDTPIRPCRTWEAHEDGAVCSLELNDYTVVTGSSKGTIKVWDILTLSLLRTFPPPVTRPPCNDPVGQIFLRDDLLIANVGARVLVWQAKPVFPNKKIKVKRPGKPNKGRGVSAAMNRWQQQMEVLNDIKETKQDIEAERARINRVNGRIRAEQMSLDGLGLTEAEAIDYLLMLSREEEEERRRLASDVGLSSSLSISSAASAPLSTLNRSANMDALFALDGVDVDSEHLASPNATADSGRQSCHTTWSTSSDDISSDSRSSASSLDDSSEFPSIGSVSSNARVQRHTEPVRLAGSWSQGSPVGSWQRQSPNEIAASPLSARSSFRSQLLTRQTCDEEDEELKFALELSLAEARSRGEV